MGVAWVERWAILLGLASLAAGQDCSGQLAASRRCMRQFHEAKRQRFETEVKPRLDACFVEAGCENPGPVMNEARRCKESIVRDQIVPALQGCPGAEALDPEDLVAKLAGKGKGHHGKGHHGHHRRHRHHHGGGGMAMKMVAAFCSERSAAQAAMECVAGVMAEEHGGEEAGPSGLPSQAEFTEDRQRMQCKMEIRDYACLQAKFAAKEALCECAQSWSLDEAAVNEALTQCEPQQLQQSRSSFGFWRAEQPLDKIKGKVCRERRGGFRGGFGGGPGGGGFGGPRRSFGGSRGSRRGSLGGRSFGRGSFGSGGGRGRSFGFSTTPLPFDGRRRSFGGRGGGRGNRWF